MKKILIIFFLTITTLVLLIFFKPEIIINPRSFELILNKTAVFREFSWKDSRFEHRFNKWNDRSFTGYFSNFCFHLQKKGMEVKSCLEIVSWDINLTWSWKKGFIVQSSKPLFLRSPLVEITLLSSDGSSGSPPEVWKWWSLLWSPVVPELDVIVNEIKINKDKKTYSFDFLLTKLAKELFMNIWDVDLKASPEKIVVTLPSHYKISKDLNLRRSLHLNEVALTALMKEEGIPLKLTGNLEAISFNVKSYMDLPLTNDFVKKLLVATTGEFEILKLNENIQKYVPKPYNILPAPFNVLEGDLFTFVKILNLEGSDLVKIESNTLIDLSGPKQNLKLDIASAVPLSVKDYGFGPIEIGVDFKKVMLQLPRLSKRSPPPQLIPDRRFKKSLESLPKENQKKLDISFDLQALNKQALHIKSNLLDEPLRMNFDLKIKTGEIQKGFVQLLPLKTTIFKRPINVQNVVVTFNAPVDPVIGATIKFLLPEYKITLTLEGPISDPRYAFSSDPPLPQSDIYSVLLFGRPLAELDPNDKMAANKTNKLLAQGILSLSVLYFLAGSPVEYVGYDPESKNTTAQFGLGKKSSIRVGGSREGVNSTAIRRSLGKGWFIDTSVQDSSTPTSRDEKNYGVLLERIIAY